MTPEMAEPDRGEVRQAQPATPPAERRYERAFLLSPEERDAWTTLMRAYASIVRELDDDLRRAHGLSLASYEVLAQLFLAPGHRLRMTELARSLVYTRGGVTRLVERLERGGLVRRSAVEQDARGIYACLTDRGFQVFDRSTDTHVQSLRRLFFSKLGRRDLRDLRHVAERLLASTQAHERQGRDE